LYPDRLVEAKLFTQPLQLLVRCMVPEQQLGNVAGEQVHRDEHHDTDADQHEQQLDQAGSDVFPHQLPPRFAITGQARPRRE
jgi:hypothetical protein